MQYVALKKRSSSIHGEGCFAQEFIPRGKLVVTWFDNFEVVPEAEHLARLQRQGRSLTGVRFCGNWFLQAADETSLEPSEFINHASDPNLFYFLGCLVA